jgi:hypothetical protein
VSGDIQLESTHQVVTVVADVVAVVVLAVLVGRLAELVPAASIGVMTTITTRPSLRTERIMAPATVAWGSRYGHVGPLVDVDLGERIVTV